jgi:predicted transcriptional regulator
VNPKELVLEAIRKLPDDATIDEIADRVTFIAAVKKGVEDLDRGAVVPHTEMKRQLAAWLSA